jgi:predicted NUDIX family phosphoesterase
MNKDEEMVMVVDKNVIEKLNVNDSGYAFFNYHFFNNCHYKFLPRKLMELDENYKQIILYITLTHSEKGFYCYQRTKLAGEERLHGKWSLGIGGHINDCDNVAHDFYGTYDKGRARELLEETNITNPGFSYVKCLIYDNSNQVGKVHLGFFETREVDHDINSSDYSIAHGQWLNFEQILEKYKNNEFENWSNIVIKFLLDNLQNYL